MYDHIKAEDSEVYSAIMQEIGRQRNKIELIASENMVSEAVLEAAGSPLTNKYAEGYPGKRYYGGCEYVDIVEQLAIDRAKQLFGAEHVNVQPHSEDPLSVRRFSTAFTFPDTEAMIFADTKPSASPITCPTRTGSFLLTTGLAGRPIF